MSISRDFQRRIALDEIRALGHFHYVEWHESIDSTNRSLGRWIRNDTVRLPALLIADNQTAGVGRGGNQWWSPQGCLMFSMAFSLPFDHGRSLWTERHQDLNALLPLRVGCTVAECLDAISSMPPKVKWPNDVFIAGKKVSGVLIDVVPTSRVPIAVVGVGINCQVDFSGAPSELASIATSLHRWVHPDQRELASPENVLVSFIRQWLEWDQVEQFDVERLMHVWRQRSMLDHAWVEVKHSGGMVQGRCVGIHQNGALLIQNERLETTEVLAGTVVSYRLPEDRQ